MSRASRWLHRNSRQRELAIGLVCGSSTVLAYGVYHGSHRPLRLDSSEPPQAWMSGTSIVASHNLPLSDQSRDLRGVEPQSKVKVGENVSSSSTTNSQNSSVLSPDILAEGEAAWTSAIQRISSMTGSLTSFDVDNVREKISGLLIPGWARMLPRWISKIQDELSMAPGSLSWEIWEEAHDPEIHPEIVWDARVRVSPDLCGEEQAFLNKRLARTTKALANYLDVPESDVHPDDVPIIAMCGSGGGLRALVAGAASFLSTQEAGLFDCVTYTAGVSGSCWLQTLYNSSIGRQDHARIIAHLKDRIGIHIASPPTLLTQLSQAPTNKYLLSGFVEKLRGVPDADFGLVDVYGLALAARLLVPRGELRVNDADLKVSNQRSYTDQGQSPLPIYTAVRHELPQQNVDLDESPSFETKNQGSFQTFEMTPYEFYCEDLEAGIPSWAVGRQWKAGETVWRDNGLALPELRVPLYLGIWGSAFCATLLHYHREIQPILQASGMSALDALLGNKDADLVKVHPIDPAVVPNYALGLRGRLPASAPESIHTATHLQLMDAGMDNNLPIYPLLRPGRNVDVIVTFDASADVRRDNWLRVVDGYAQQRNLTRWPPGSGWPDIQAPDLAEKDENHSPSAPNTAEDAEPPGLGPCTIWPLTSSSSSASSTGITVIYFPFLAHPSSSAASAASTTSVLDPQTDAVTSTWNFVYTPAQIEQVVELARANFEAGREQTRGRIRAVWEEKRRRRMEKEKEEERWSEGLFGV